jgi:CheY-like chemotaxis protein
MVQEPPAGGPMRVLVVDDNRDAANSLALLVRLWGHEARVAYGGADGLHAAVEFRPQAAFLDVEMPGMHGGQLAQAIRATPGLEKILLVAASGSDPDDPRLAPYVTLFDDFVRKPYNLPRLEALLAARAAHPAG